jgi:hypothetical protein
MNATPAQRLPAQRFIVHVKPNSSQQCLVQQNDGSWIARIHAPPEDGKANAAVIQLIAKHFHVAKRDVIIARGHNQRCKQIDVFGIESQGTGPCPSNREA